METEMDLPHSYGMDRRVLHSPKEDHREENDDDNSDGEEDVESQEQEWQEDEQEQEEVQGAGGESDVAEQRGAAAGLCKALPQPRSHSASMEAQSISEIHSLC